MTKQISASQLWGRELRNDEIHIWYASLDKPVPWFRKLLSSDEGKRTKRVQFDEHQKRFIVRLGILRTILGHYLSVNPSSIQFTYGKNGKPALADTFGRGTVHFNLSHSNGIALYAFTRDREIGVDIEHIRDISEVEQIVERFFSEREKAVFRV
jgi:4'-phosphopantetheinyl transferase